MAQAESAVEASRDPDPRTPPSRDWLIRSLDALPVSPFRLGLGIALVYLAAAVLYQNAVGAMHGLASARVGSSIFIESTNGLIAGWLLAVIVHGRRAMAADLRKLGPRLSCSTARCEELLAAAVSPPRWAMRTATAFGVGAGLALVILDPQVRGGARLTLDDPLIVWSAIRNMIVSICVTHALLADVVSIVAYAAIGSHHLEIDVLDQRSLGAFARKGQRSALGWVGFSALISTFWASDQAGAVNGLLVALIAGLVTASFWLPLRGVHRTLAAAKSRELERADAEVRRAREALASGTGAPHALADWIAWRGLVEQTREWPVSTPGVLRYGLLILLGVGSWLGGAVVERLLELLLD